MNRAVVIHCLDMLVKKSFFFIEKSKKHDFVESSGLVSLKRNSKYKRLMGNASEGWACVLRDVAKFANSTSCYQNSSPV